jgi:ubiquinol-cytochrome c reductase cytochrome c subunit
MHKSFAVLAAGLAIFAACFYTTEEPAPFRPPIALDESPPDGRILFMRYCSWCHGSDGSGTERAPEISSDGAAAADFMLTTGRMPLEDPEDRMRRSDSAFDAEQIAAIVAFVSDLGPGPAVPEVSPGAGDLALGAELYELNCAACHSTTGIGGALTSGQEASSLHLATPTQTAEAMLTGPGAMPVFGSETFDGHEVDSLVAYVDYLKHPDQRGGSDLGRLGPWSEGLVAWVIGLGSCLLVIRMIGSRARR